MTRVRCRQKLTKPQCAPARILAERAAWGLPLLRSLPSARFAAPASCDGGLSEFARSETGTPVHETLHPQLEREKLPNLHGPVLLALAVLFDILRYGRGLKQSAVTH